MKENFQRRCDLFFANYKEIKQVYRWENISLVSVCAATLMNTDQIVDSAKLQSCKEMLKAQTGLFSNFRGNVELPVISLIAASDNPAGKLQKSLQYYNALKEKFMGSEYLVLAATILAESVSEGYIDSVAARAKKLYQLMKEEHPFLTSSEDSVLAAMMAASDKTDDNALINEAETIYQTLKNYFSSGNSVQSVAFILALADGNTDAKCQKMLSLYNSLKAAGAKYGKYHELSTLAALSLLPVGVETMTEDILAVDARLAEEKPYSGLFGIDKKTRLMHAAMLVSCEYSKSNDANITAMTGTLAMIAAQQAALCAAICASSAAAASASSSN